ncbi:hypothetical protein [Actinoplanes sp. NBRC 101535]|uniref:hypothetical protein n=1 Tax=Actinoplanes sp. NBRC 101535 TaxID=3032196 RepID=UPI0024A5A7A1|nr:hypothetical protein [Actinoplanes sp. NBRC 101535]GLY03091.1 hypothetical protein Acsp01_34700 [Actinoplanes sp. NBRC 101535]
MTDPVEESLRATLHRQADDAPHLTDDVFRIPQRVHRQRLRTAAAGLALAVLAGTGATVYALQPPPPAGHQQGPLPGGGQDCDVAEPEDVAGRGFAFDGTVTGIDGDTTGSIVSVSFTVHEWFRGDTGTATTVQMAAPVVFPELASEAGPSYTVGTRLLVSGDLPMARGCGNTRYYDPATAAIWRTATR